MPNDVPVVMTGVRIIPGPDRDLEIAVAGLLAPVLGKVVLNRKGTELTITTNLPGVSKRRVPFVALPGLAAHPVPVKLPRNDNCIVIYSITGLPSRRKRHGQEAPLPN